MKKRRTYPERDLQRDVVRLLTATLPSDAMWTAIMPVTFTDARTGGKAKALGVQPGIPDLLVIHHGISLWIELKAPGGSLSDNQKEMHRRLVKAHSYPNEAYTRSGTVVVCKSLDEVRMALASHRMTMEKAAA